MLGIHVNRSFTVGHAGHDGHTRHSILEHILAAQKAAADEGGVDLRAAAIFVAGPRNREITLHEEEAAELQRHIKAHHLFVVAHNTYSAPLWAHSATPSEHAMSGHSATPSEHAPSGHAPSQKKDTSFICKQLEVCASAGIQGFVLHLPKAPPPVVLQGITALLAQARAMRATALAQALAPRIYLETPAVRPTESYYETPKKLAALFTAIGTADGPDPGLKHFGLCIDTAHLWTCGVDISSYAVTDQWFRALERYHDVIPPTSIMIHLNDSLRELGTGPDSHAGLTRGKIWEPYRKRIGESGLAAVVDYAKRHKIPMILERNHAEELKYDYFILRELDPGLAVS